MCVQERGGVEGLDVMVIQPVPMTGPPYLLPSHLEESLGHCPPGVDDTLGDAFAVELRELLDQVVVLEEDGPPGTNCRDQEGR